MNGILTETFYCGTSSSSSFLREDGWKTTYIQKIIYHKELRRVPSIFFFFSFFNLIYFIHNAAVEKQLTLLSNYYQHFVTYNQYFVLNSYLKYFFNNICILGSFTYDFCQYLDPLPPPWIQCILNGFLDSYKVQLLVRCFNLPPPNQ